MKSEIIKNSSHIFKLYCTQIQWWSEKDPVKWFDTGVFQDGPVSKVLGPLLPGISCTSDVCYVRWGRIGVGFDGVSWVLVHGVVHGSFLCQNTYVGFFRERSRITIPLFITSRSSLLSQLMLSLNDLNLN